MLIFLFVLATFMVVSPFMFKKFGDTEASEAVFVIGLSVFTALSILSLGSYASHTDDLGIIRAQHERIKVYEERIASLKQDMRDLIPEGKEVGTLFNADSPIKSMVDQLAAANEQLARAKDIKAKALVYISKRDAGFFWPIVAINGRN